MQAGGCSRIHLHAMHRFWEGWLKWSVEAGIDYFVGGKIPAWLDLLGLKVVAGEGHPRSSTAGLIGQHSGLRPYTSWRPHC